MTFNGHHTTEFGLLESTDDSIGMPTKNKTIFTPIGSNRIIDLSNLYGPTFSERVINKTFLVDTGMWTPERQYIMWTKVINWLMQPKSKLPLWDDVMDDWHYLAEVQEAPIFKEGYHQATIQVAWQCYPFRIKDRAEFDDVWDTFNFEIDVAQNTHLSKKHSSTILINTGVADVVFQVISDATATIKINDEEYPITLGRNENTEFVLVPGENSISVLGEANIDIRWHREVI